MSTESALEIPKEDTRLAYQVWPGNNSFLLAGRFILGPDTNILILTLVMISIPSVVFNVFVAPTLSKEVSPVIFVFGLIWPVWCLAMLIKTSVSDPGIIPRQPFPANGTRNLPRVQDVMVNGHVVKSKYCETCNLYRPPRCSHCSVCNNCVERFDHHCPWVGQCVGRRNYRYYLLFINSTTILCIYVFVCSAIQVKLKMDDMNKGSSDATIWDALKETPFAIGLMVYVFLCVWFVGGLSAFHGHLISTNQTTYENFRFHLDSENNPYNEGVARNCYLTVCTPIPKSKLTLRRRAFVEGTSTPNYGKPLGPMDGLVNTNNAVTPGYSGSYQMSPTVPSDNNNQGNGDLDPQSAHFASTPHAEQDEDSEQRSATARQAAAELVRRMSNDEQSWSQDIQLEIGNRVDP
mmetsp:Transcript_22350/g.42632  ORF Transcript_22350/g.42632 Transcript_22350/m.42632 type:complete len:405 (-) Transcript_22350:344-1558(-)|eukprot:CAMPEP_0114250984 /NCGR_PEP_ID=MMETSP0058-20121206/15010_1 /TAXON_ID=36894 /ORGANISM="Pyramimonas parkeae, CCMP726" /LENGTH=404 /DNA_ID=CAMNT_0001364719 /DNA_START=425 /DNA_END=1639 /DNA_ORIENTATION=+